MRLPRTIKAIENSLTSVSPAVPSAVFFINCARILFLRFVPFVIFSPVLVKQCANKVCPRITSRRWIYEGLLSVKEKKKLSFTTIRTERQSCRVSGRYRQRPGQDWWNVMGVASIVLCKKKKKKKLNLYAERKAE